MNNLAPMRNCPGVEGRLYWMPEYESFVSVRFGLRNTVGGVSQYKFGLI